MTQPLMKALVQMRMALPVYDFQSTVLSKNEVEPQPPELEFPSEKLWTHACTLSLIHI